jgi:hypothetical protein
MAGAEWRPCPYYGVIRPLTHLIARYAMEVVELNEGCDLRRSPQETAYFFSGQ